MALIDKNIAIEDIKTENISDIAFAIYNKLNALIDEIDRTSCIVKNTSGDKQLKETRDKSIEIIANILNIDKANISKLSKILETPLEEDEPDDKIPERFFAEITKLKEI